MLEAPQMKPPKVKSKSASWWGKFEMSAGWPPTIKGSWMFRKRLLKVVLRICLTMRLFKPVFLHWDALNTTKRTSKQQTTLMATTWRHTMSAPSTRVPFKDQGTKVITNVERILSMSTCNTSWHICRDKLMVRKRKVFSVEDSATPKQLNVLLQKEKIKQKRIRWSSCELLDVQDGHKQLEDFRHRRLVNQNWQDRLERHFEWLRCLNHLRSYHCKRKDKIIAFDTFASKQQLTVRSQQQCKTLSPRLECWILMLTKQHYRGQVAWCPCQPVEEIQELSRHRCDPILAQ